jgi:hypothetical protein
MTSSLKSKFDIGKRRAMFVSAHKLAVYHWHRGDLGSSYLFDANNDGREYFERYLRETPKIPVYFLVDVFEEEFKLDTVPHVFGSDRDAIILRKKARLFRETPYYYSKIQGREQEGRKDDHILLSAITNPNIIKPWMEILEKYQVPLVGIYSIPLLTNSLSKLLQGTSENKLIVSIQSISGLRQTFIQNNQLQVSRLVQLPRYGTESYGPHIKEEVEKIKRYLNNVRMIPSNIPRGDSLNTYFIMNNEVIQELKNEYKNTSSIGMHYLDINEMLSRSGSARHVTTPFSDQLFVHHILKQKPADNYAQSREKRFNMMRNIRTSLLACSALLLAASLFWSGITFMRGLDLRESTLSAQRSSEFYEDRYQLAREGLPETPVEAADLKIAVELVDILESYKTTPYEMIRLISFAMNQFPAVKMERFQWLAGPDPNVRMTSSRNERNTRAINYTNTTSGSSNYNYYQIAVLEGELMPFDGNYRRAISLINEYADTLRNQANVYDISIISLPLDISSEASMQGNTNSTQREARFSIRVVLGIEHEV